VKFRVRHEWRLGGLYIPSGAGTDAAVLMLHGFPGVLKNEDIAADLCRRGLTVFMPFYGGCWGSPGRFSLKGAFDDARTALRLLSRYRRVDERRIGILGYSFGGWTALRMASETPVAAVAALAPAVPYGDGASEARYLRRNAKVVNIASLNDLWKEYEAESRRERPDVYLPRIWPTPLLIVQGLKDRLVRPESSAKLWALAEQPKKLAAFPHEDHEFQHDRAAVTAEVCGWLESRLCHASPPSRFTAPAALR
jgi:esterase/lipase